MRGFALIMLASAAGALGGTPARAFDDYAGPLGTTTSIYGQFSPSLLSAHDGDGYTTALADNSNSVSRLGLRIQREFDLGTFQLRFETAMGFRESKSVKQTSSVKGFDWDRTDIRFVDASFHFGGRGVFSVGHGSMATDQVAMADLSGTTLATSVSVPDMAGGMVFRTQSGVLTGIPVKSAFNTFDGVRRARLRYDFRPIRGVTLSVSAGSEVLRQRNDEQNFDAAITYVESFRGIELEGAMGASISSLNNQRTRKDLVGSVSARHPGSGLNLTLASGQGSAGGVFYYAKLGLRRGWWDIGHTAVSVDFHRGHDIATPGSSSTAWGIGIVQRLDRQEVDLFLGYRNYALDGPALDLQDVQAVQMGARWRF